MTGADALAAALGKDTCDLEGMDDKLAGCLKDMQTRVKTLEQALLSGGLYFMMQCKILIFE